MKESVEIIIKKINEEVKILGTSERVFLAGFSQGCALSLATFLRYPGKLGGVAGLSGMNCLDPLDWVN